MNTEFINQLNIYIAEGTNAFTMTRGSFNYRQKIRNKRKLVPTSAEGLYTDPHTGDEYKLNLEVSDTGRLHMWLETSHADSIVSHTDSKISPAGTIDQTACLSPAAGTSSHSFRTPSSINRFYIELPADPEAHYYGCGETFSEFDLKGKKVRIWTAEHQNSRRISHKIIRDRLTGRHPNHKLKFDRYESYYVQPTFITAIPGGSFKYLHVDTTSFCIFDFTQKDKITLFIQDIPDIYIGEAVSPGKLSDALGALLGRQGDLPDWIYDGVILASQEGTSSIEKKIALADKYDIPLIGFWSQDWCGCRRTGFGYQVMWNWEWDKDLYNDLDRKIPEFNAKGIRILGYINPFMALEKDLYKYASSKGYCVKDHDGKDYLVTITTFPAAMIDLTNPAAWEWYKSVIKKNMIAFGLSGWMADFGEYLPTDCVLFDGSDPEKRHNEWPALWAKLNSEAVFETGRKDIFFFTRAGFTDTIRYSPLMWNGDQHVDFSIDDGIGSVIPATLSLGISGFGITHSDIGGYTTIMNMTRNKELLMRWEEMNAFSPVMRFHEGNQPSRNVQFDADEELLKHLSVFVRIHVLLKDYLKKCVAECAESSVPVMRPVFYHYDEDWAYTESSEYLLGRDMLVAPVLKEGAGSREVHLPDDKWIHIFTEKEYDGGVCVVDAPIGMPPVFIRQSAVSYFTDFMSQLHMKSNQVE